jgi:hypothetical protein
MPGLETRVSSPQMAAGAVVAAGAVADADAAAVANRRCGGWYHGGWLVVMWCERLVPTCLSQV